LDCPGFCTTVRKRVYITASGRENDFGVTKGLRAAAPDGTNCQDVQTTPSIQNNVQGEQAKLVNDLAPFKYYPLMPLTIGYRF
jgi:hypothetical protein